MYGGSCTTAYVVGMLDTLKKLKAHDYEMLFAFLANESLIPRGRNSLVKEFLEKTDAGYLLFIDADIGFTGDDVLKLIAADKDIICGLYPKKRIDWGRVNRVAKEGLAKYNIEDLEKISCMYAVNPVSLDETHDEPLSSPVVEINHGGTGFMLIKRSVFNTLSPYVKEYRNITVCDQNGNMPSLIKEFFALDIVGENKYFLSEDYFFCNLWKRYGGKVYADLSIELSHFGTYMFKGSLMVGGANMGN